MTIAKALARGEEGYPHREHRSGKGRKPFKPNGTQLKLMRLDKLRRKEQNRI